MIWTCKKCGKELDVSQEQLEETGGVVVCPQCLASSKVAGVTSRRNAAKPAPVAEEEPVRQAPPARPQRSASYEQPATPPPHRKRSTTPPTPPPRRASQPSRSQVTTQPLRSESRMKKKTEDNNSSKGFLHTIANPPSPLGCLWRSALVTVGLLLIYIFFGLIFSL